MHCYILSIQAVGLMDIEKKIKKNNIFSLWILLIFRGVTSLHPRGVIGSFYVAYH